MSSATDTTSPDLAAIQARLDRLNARRPSPATSTAPPAKRPRRRHAAAGSRLAALGISVASTSGLGAYFLATNPTASGTQVTAATVMDGSSASVSPRPSGTTTPAATVQGGTYRNRWGDVQVQATFGPDGALTAVDALETPGGRSRSVRINERAVPRLEAEALAAQGAHIDTVSGATYTSSDYRRSLQSAIDAARGAGLTSLA